MSKKETGKDLSEKQKRFCRAYLKILNATQAALRSGYDRKKIVEK